MSTNIEAIDQTDAIDHAAADLPDADLPEYSPKMDMVYLKVAGILVVLTAMEVYASYSDYLGKFFLPLMLGLMATKFVLVVLFFMHLRWDSKLFGRLFWAGAFLAVAVYVGALATFQYFAKA